jgi:hypothetical protein
LQRAVTIQRVILIIICKYPSLIRRNRTSIAVLEGDETAEELDRLADDVYSCILALVAGM